MFGRPRIPAVFVFVFVVGAVAGFVHGLGRGGGGRRPVNDRPRLPLTPAEAAAFGDLAAEFYSTIPAPTTGGSPT